MIERARLFHSFYHLLSLVGRIFGLMIETRFGSSIFNINNISARNSARARTHFIA